MSPDALLRLEKRREQNRRASMKLRNKKKDEEKQLMEKVVKLESERKESESDIARLQKELEYLTKLLHNHPCKLDQPGNAIDHHPCRLDQSRNTTEEPEPHDPLGIQSAHDHTETFPDIEDYKTPAENFGASYFTDLMLNTHFEDDVASELNGQFPTVENNFTFIGQTETFDVPPESPLVMITDYARVNPDPINGIGSPIDNYVMNDGNSDTMYSPTERKRTTHFQFPEPTEPTMCDLPDLNRDLELEEMLRQYRCEIPLSQSCVDVSFFNMEEQP